MEVFARMPVDLDEMHIPRGEVYLIMERCKGCKLCVELCPQKVLEISEDLNEKGYHYPRIASGKEDSCVHCEFCAMICPEFAIYTLEVSA